MTDVAAELVGVQRLTATLDAAAARFADLREPGRLAGGDVITAARVPYLTGALDSTVAVLPGPSGFVLVAGGQAAPYAAAVHARNPFLLRALTARQDAVIDTYTEHAAGLLDTIEGA